MPSIYEPHIAAEYYCQQHWRLRWFTILWTSLIAISWPLGLVEIGRIAVSKGWNNKIAEDIIVLAAFSAITLGLWRIVAYLKEQHQQWAKMAENFVPEVDDFRPENVDWT